MDELQKFKTAINLIQYARIKGYLEEQHKVTTVDDLISSRKSSVTMRHPDGDKIVISVNGNGHWVYFSVRDNRDKGSVIDFEQWRGGGTLGQIRKTLRGHICNQPPLEKSIPCLVPIEKKRATILEAWVRMLPCLALAYLALRGITPRTLAISRFHDCIRVDSNKNAVFPHYDQDGLCGYELKNYAFTGFSPGGTKGLWCSRASSQDKRLVFCESAIDAISFHILAGDETTRYISVSGALNKIQPALIRAAIERMPSGSEILLAFDDDEGGEKLADAVWAVAPAGADLRRALPPVGMGKDWNEALKQSRGLGILDPEPEKYVFDPSFFGPVAHAPEGATALQKGHRSQRLNLGPGKRK